MCLMYPMVINRMSAARSAWKERVMEYVISYARKNASKQANL